MLQEQKKRKCPKGYVKEQIEKSRLEATTLHGSQEQALETRAAELTQNGAPCLQEISPKRQRTREAHLRAQAHFDVSVDIYTQHSLPTPVQNPAFHAVSPTVREEEFLNLYFLRTILQKSVRNTTVGD